MWFLLLYSYTYTNLYLYITFICTMIFILSKPIYQTKSLCSLNSLIWKYTQICYKNTTSGKYQGNVNVFWVYFWLYLETGWSNLLTHLDSSLIKNIQWFVTKIISFDIKMQHKICHFRWYPKSFYCCNFETKSDRYILIIPLFSALKTI